MKHGKQIIGRLDQLGNLTWIVEGDCRPSELDKNTEDVC